MGEKLGERGRERLGERTWENTGRARERKR